MPTYKYLIIGGGMTADAAVRGIREIDEEGSIGLLSAEPDPPYNRPPLSKGLWKNQKLERIWRHTQELGVTLHLDCRAVELDVDQKQVIDEEGTEYEYEKLLLATGGTPRHLPFEHDAEQIIYFRTLADYKRLRDLTEEKEHFAIIGGGFIGSEIAAALLLNDKEATMLFPEAGIGALALPEDLAFYLTDYYRDEGVAVHPGELVTGLERRDDLFVVKTKDGREIEAEAVVARLGLIPNTDLAEEAGLEVDHGIVVNETLQTSDPDVYAAGDVAAFYVSALDKRIRVEHEDNANSMGQQAGRAMAGQAEPYDYLPFFYSDLFDLNYIGVGDLDPDLETVVDWTEEYEKGVIYYLKKGRVRGVALWNIWGQQEAARKLIAEPGPFEPEDLKGRLPEG